MKSYILLVISIVLSTLTFCQAPDCNTIVVTTGSGSITVSGVNAAPIVGIQIFNSSWASVFSQTYTSHGDVIQVSPISPGQYNVNVRFYNSNWSSICEKVSNVTVSDNPPPPADTCSPTFQKTFGNIGGEEYANDLVRTSDGGYMVAGLASVTGNTNQDALLLKVDKEGSFLWSRTFGGAQADFFYSLIQTADGGFLAGGAMNSAGMTTFSGDAWLVKTDANGNTLWQKRYSDNSNPGRIHTLTQTSDGGYAFFGTFPFMPGGSDWMLVKTDGNGNIQWQKKFGTGSSDDGIGIVEDNHGGAGLVVTGYNYSSTNYDADIVKFDLATGNLLWSKTYDLDGRTNRFKRIHKAVDGFLISAVTHDGFDAANAVFVLIKTDFNGNILLAREVKAPGTGDGHVTVLPDGGYMLAVGETLPAPNSDIHLIKLDAGGSIVWAKKYPRPEPQWINRLILDGNYVVGAGFANSGSYNDLMLIKSDLSGKTGSCSSENVLATARTPVITTLNSPFTINTSLNLVANNTNVASTSLNVGATVLCIENCVIPPTITISNATVNENAGNAVLQVCLSATSTQTVTVQFATANGSAIAGSDYTATSSTATIPSGQTCTTVSIPILNDASAESTENFTVTLTNPTNATIGNGTATVTINDDDQSQFNCNNVSINPGNNQINITGLTAPVITVQVFNSSWATVFNQSYTNSPGTVNVPIAPGAYLVKVTFYTSNWSYICDKSQNVTVINQCPAGTICISNICPAQTVDLNTAYSIPNLPAGTTVSWHSGNPATDANKMTAQQAQNVSVSGTYYAAINISGANCYSATIPVNVTITPCSSSPVVNAIELKSDGERATRKIMVFPNPFTSSVRVIIDSEKKERATLMFTDLMGRQLQRKPIQLVPGSNTVMLEGLDKYPSGNYFLQIASPEGMKTFKLIRQQ